MKELIYTDFRLLNQYLLNIMEFNSSREKFIAN